MERVLMNKNSQMNKCRKGIPDRGRTQFGAIMKQASVIGHQTGHRGIIGHTKEFRLILYTVEGGNHMF